MNSPGFLVIGAQKCGTSWLHHHLRQHPQIFMPADKDATLYFKDASEAEIYLRRFATASPLQISGDACAGYFWTRNTGPYPAEFNPDISRAIHQHLGGSLKLIVLVKDPVLRAVSGYLHHIAHGTLDANCAIMDAPDELGIVALSRYGHHLQCWLESYSSSQVLVLPAPSSTNGAFLLDRVCEFLDVRRDITLQSQPRIVFPGLVRLNLEDGIWVALDQPGMSIESLHRTSHILEHGDRRYIRLIHATELRCLAECLADDTCHFMRLVQTHGWDHPEFLKWNGCPK